jgi:hypothetical protein
MIINVRRYSCKIPVILIGFEQILNIFRYIFEKFSNTKFHENLSFESWFGPCGQTDGQT